MKIHIYTDGSASSKDRAGGYSAVIIRETNGEFQVLETLCGRDYGIKKNATSSRMEMKGVILGLGYCKINKINAKFYIDSKFLVKSFNIWMDYWVKHDWEKSNGKKVANTDLWGNITTLLDGHSHEFEWVKSHNGNEYNELADKLAKNMREYV